MNIQTTLKTYGFSENEAKVYMTLLKTSDISAFQISKKTALPRTSVYHILESLEHQGIVSSWKKNNVAYFFAENPKRLIDILEKKKEIIQSVMQDMLALKSEGEANPAAKLYTGVEGMKIVWNDILETLDREGIKELHAISHPKIYDHLPKFFPQWLKRREKMKIKSYIILADSEESKHIDMKSNEYRESRLLPSGSPVKGTIDIYANKIAYFGMKEGEVYSIILESASMAELMRQFFVATWQLLGEKNKY